MISRVRFKQKIINDYKFDLLNHISLETKKLQDNQI